MRLSLESKLSEEVEGLKKILLLIMPSQAL